MIRFYFICIILLAIFWGYNDYRSAQVSANILKWVLSIFTRFLTANSSEKEDPIWTFF